MPRDIAEINLESSTIISENNANAAKAERIATLLLDIGENVEELQTQSSVVLTPITYAALLALRNADSLVVEKSYLITDYKTVYQQPYTYIISNSAQGITDGLDTTVEPIIVIARTVNRLYDEAYSTVYTDQILKYDIDADLTYGSGTETKGAILNRKEPRRKLNIDFDFIAMKFRRFKTAYTTYGAGTTYAQYDCVESAGTIYMSLQAGNIGNAVAPSNNIWWTKMYPTSGYFPYISTDEWGLDVIPIDNTDFVDVFLFQGSSANPIEEWWSIWDITIKADLLGANYGDNYVNIVFFNVENSLENIHLEATVLDMTFHGLNTKVSGLSYLGSGNSWCYNFCWYGSVYGVQMAEVGLTNSIISSIRNTTIRYMRNTIIKSWNGFGTEIFVYELNTNNARIFANITWARSVYVYNSFIQSYHNIQTRGDVYVSNSEIRDTEWYVVSTQINNKDIYLDGTTVNASYVSNCPVRMINCTINGSLIDVSVPDGCEWRGVTIPANVSFKNVSFENQFWYGQNVWIGSAVNLIGKKISKFYSDNYTDPSAATVEKLWYEETDVNGITNYLILE